jgi:hypothetical protein
MPISVRTVASLLFAAALVLASVLPALAYNEENVKHIRLHRLDAIQCGSPIRIVADLTDKKGAAVAGATVNFSLKKGQPGDVLAPTTNASDTEGRARTTLTMSSFQGTRIVVASVPGDGKAQITIQAKKGDPGCTQKGNGGGDEDDDDEGGGHDGGGDNGGHDGDHGDHGDHHGRHHGPGDDD